MLYMSFEHHSSTNVTVSEHMIKSTIITQNMRIQDATMSLKNFRVLLPWFVQGI